MLVPTLYYFTYKARKLRSWNKVALSIIWGHTQIFHHENTIQTHWSQPQSTTEYSLSARQYGSRFIPSRKKVAATNSTVRKLFNTKKLRENKYKDPNHNETTYTIRSSSATSSILDNLCSSMVPPRHGLDLRLSMDTNMIHDQHNVKTRKGWMRSGNQEQCNVWKWHPPALGAVVTKVQMRKWLQHDEPIRILLQNNDNVNEAVNNGQTQHMQNTVKLWSARQWWWTGFFFLFRNPATIFPSKLFLFFRLW